MRFWSTSPPWAISCSVFWMQKLRGSARRPVELPSLSAQDEKLHWLRQPMQSAWSLRITVFSSGVTNTSVLSGVFKASTKRSEEHTSELQSLMRISYAVFCLKKKTIQPKTTHIDLNSLSH